MNEEYQTPKEWYKANYRNRSLKKYRGQWIAYTKDGVIAHHPDFATMRAQIDPDRTDYVIAHIHALQFVERVKFYPVRFRSVKSHNWEPLYEVIISFAGSPSTRIQMLVDSGAELSLLPKELGRGLGLVKYPGDVVNQADTVGGKVEYLLKNMEMTIDGHSFTAPVAWLQTDNGQEVLLGREIVFDYFNIEFRQADEEIIFTWRGPE